MSYQVTRKQERILVLGALVALAMISWGYTIHLGLQHQSMAGTMAMPAMTYWSTADALFMFIMWAVMMFAMMLPSVTPTVLIFGRVREKREAAGRIFAPTGAFVAGYLFVWVGFSLIATLTNWSMHTGGMMSSMMGKVSAQTGGVLLIAAGLFQWTRLKNACLEHCRSPMSFLMQHWREGSGGAALMGAHHGIYCLGCCWLLMLLLFTLGVMNLAWVAALTILVLVEKVIPRGEVLGRGLGVLFVGWGAWMIVAG